MSTATAAINIPSATAAGHHDWWRQARLGMFIHWGPYAPLAGVWEGREVEGCAEHIRQTGPIPRDAYERQARAWSPRAFDAAALVALAQEAGLGYMVFTSKHHDGFCMFDSAHTDFSIAKGAFARDPMRELRIAADAAGLPLGWYYSPRDWHHPDYRIARGEQSEADLTALERYIAYVRDQTTELIDRYGPVATLWYDGQDNGPQTARSDELLACIRALSPATLVNDRIGLEGYHADYAICEGYVPGEGPDRPWETCLSLNYSWGFRANDQRWCPAHELARKVCDAIGLGGNMLINVGPDGDGVIPAPAEAILRTFGRWMRVHGEALHGTTALPPLTDDIRLTRSSDAMYALLLDPTAGEVLLPRVWAGMVPRLLGGRELPWKQGQDGLRVTLPAAKDGMPRIVLLPNATLMP